MSRTYALIKEKKKAGLNELSQMSSAKSARRKQVHPNFITLSQAMVEYPQSFEENKISIVQKFVSEIDLLPKKFLKVETLYLSSNNIRTLEGLQQFSNLKNLSLANNEIEDAGSLHVLEELPTIEVLNLNGNPICQIPNYRSLVISLLPRLRSFDGKAVTTEEKHKSEVNLRTQSGLLDILLKNYCELIKMNNLSRKLEVHKELLTKNSKFARNYVRFDIGKWRKMYDYEQQLDIRSKNVLKANLLQDVNTLKKEIGLKEEENDVAFSELILRQQQKIAELLFKAEESAKYMSTFQTRHSTRKSVDFEYTDTKQHEKLGASFQSAKSPKTVTFSSRDKGIKPAAISTEPLSQQRSIKSIQKKTVQNQENNFEKDIYQKLTRSQLGTPALDPLVSPLYSIRSNVPQSVGIGRDLPGFPISTKAHTHTSPKRARSPLSPRLSPLRAGIPEPSRLITTPSHIDECCRPVHRRVNQIDLDTVKPNNLEKSRSPFKKRLEEKERLIDNLSRDLRVKSQELIKYEGITNQLTERLRAFQSQNQENVKVASVEIDTLTRELEKSREAQFILEETVRGMREELEDVYSKHQDLEQHSRHLIDIEEKANIYAQELEERNNEDNLSATAFLWRSKKLKKTWFRMLKRAVQLSQVVSKFAMPRKQWKEKKMLKEIFSSWNRFSLINKYIKEKAMEKLNRAFVNSFNTWQHFTLNRNKLKGFFTDQDEKRLKKSLVAWKQYINQVHKKTLIYGRLNDHFVKKTKKRVLKRFIEIRKRARVDPIEEKAQLKKAQKYNTFNKKRRIFLAWRSWGKIKAKPVRILKQKSIHFKESNLLALGFKMWVEYINVNKQVLYKAKRKIARKNLDICAKYLNQWKYFQQTVIPHQKKQEVEKNNFVKRRLLRTWIDQLNLKRKLKHSEEKASKLYSSTLTKWIFNHLAKLRQKRKQLRIKSNIIKTKNLHSKTVKFFSGWNRLFRNNIESKREAFEARREALYTYFQSWKKFHNMTVVKKMHTKALERHLTRAIKDQTINVFHGWVHYTRLRKRNRDVLDLFSSRRRLSVYKGVMFELMKYARQSLKQHVTKLQAKSALLEANNRDNIEFANDLDAEKLEMIDKAKLYQEELVQLNIELEDKNRENHNMKRTIQQYDKNEKNLLEELSLKNSIVKELESKIHRSTSENQYVNGEYEKEIELLKEERLNLQRKMGALENELLHRQKSLVETERALLEKSNQATDIVKDVERKFADSVKMASEFRGVIEIKEDQVSSLLAQLQKSVEEKQELKERLAEALGTTRETRDFYEGRMKFFENQNLEMLVNMEQLKEDLVKQQKYITSLKADLRKTQHRLEVSKDRTFTEDERYIRTLRRESSVSPTGRDQVEFQSPRGIRSPRIERFRKEYSAERREYSTRKHEIDQKIHILENYMGFDEKPRATSPPNKLNKSQVIFSVRSPREDRHSYEPRNAPLSMKSLREDSTRKYEDIEIPTREVPSKISGFAKTNPLNTSIRSEKSPLKSPLDAHSLSTRNFVTRERSPLRSHRSPVRGYKSTASPTREYKSIASPTRGHKSTARLSGPGLNDAEFERMRRERLERREGLERRLESLTQSLQSDLKKAKNSNH